MSIRHAIWKVGMRPAPLPASTLATERLLEDMIVASPEILSDEWMLIGRQENTGHGGRVDLVAIAPDGALILIKIKRDRTPREVSEPMRHGDQPPKKKAQHRTSKVHR